ncbi:hypothetical protein Y900_002515 [Mycolicibacterium aromaticivorans JS19b1 = JCM 16368]|uniref:DUF4192 domain-containing protein n=1 Tax=Mycolicibacterium aromaticivorans JS19b1 = JCM 16368 TaxID=1440774 RepID=A0A064CGJ1_9MYCO|nr:DUF4192 domain-containing protein [Mycolicibacterium aromaticivorans]KDE97838.1 hypothetical protein Y900_002515 [Mycolicibacterium aromaticivorans JS19b1 = JCM 16368]
MTTHQPDHRFTRPGALIAALPAVLGFVPEKSLVLVSLEDREMGAVMRVDLPKVMDGNLTHLADVAAASGADTVVAVIIDADGASCPMCNQDYRDMCDELNAALADHDMTVYATHVVDRIEAGGRWHCVDGCGRFGAVEDPMASPLAAAAVLEGRRLYPRRSDLQAVVAVADAGRAASLVPAITAHAQARETDWRADPDGCGRRDVEAAMAIAARVSDGADLEDAELAMLACALTDVSVRDTLYALAVGAVAGNAEALWTVLARTLPDPWRTEALVLLAFSAYTRGDGPLAGLSLEAALRSDPEHRMASMLDTALQSGMRPEQIRELAGAGYRLAKRLGVRLPPRRTFGRRAV